jgi:mono/diheme cytochrome c family protein
MTSITRLPRDLPIARGVFALAMALVATPLHAQAPAQPEPDTTIAAQDVVKEGRKVYHGPGECFACHGGKLQGGPLAPALSGPSVKPADTSFAFVLHTLRAGAPHTPMVAHPGNLEDYQVIQVANYVWAVMHGKARP